MQSHRLWVLAIYALCGLAPLFLGLIALKVMRSRLGAAEMDRRRLTANARREKARTTFQALKPRYKLIALGWQFGLAIGPALCVVWLNLRLAPLFGLTRKTRLWEAPLGRMWFASFMVELIVLPLAILGLYLLLMKAYGRRQGWSAAYTEDIALGRRYPPGWSAPVDSGAP